MMEEEAEYLRLINHDYIGEFDEGKNYFAVRSMIFAAGSNYVKGMEQSEFDYYLHNLQSADPLQGFEDDWELGVYNEATFMLIINNIKCEAILHYIIDHKNLKSRDDDLVNSIYESLALKLIDRGANIHYVIHGNGQNIFLQSAILGFTTVLKYLLTQNIDVNYVNTESSNALHFACCFGQLEVIEILLQTDVNIYQRNDQDETPIAKAIIFGKFDEASLVLRSKQAENITFNLVQEIFCCLCKHVPDEVDSINLNFFKLLWEKLCKIFDLSILCNSREQSILAIYLNNTIFQSENWCNALKVILTSTIAEKLLEELAVFEKEGIFAAMMAKFHKIDVAEDNRIELIELLLSLGVKPNLYDLSKTLLYFKCEKEFDVLSLALPKDYLINSDIQENSMQYVASVFCGLCDQLNFKNLESLDRNFYNYVTQYFTPSLLNGSLKVDNVPNILTLKELSRNSARKFVLENVEVLLPKHFTDFVNSLQIPVMHKSILLLKTPLNGF